MRYRRLAGSILIGAALLLVCARIIRIENDRGASHEVRVPRPDVPIPKRAIVLRAESTTTIPDLQRASSSSAGSSTHSDLKAKFDAHIGRAESGDAASMLTIAETIETCGPVGRYENWNQYMDSPGRSAEWERNFSQEEMDVAKAWFDRLAIECRGVNEHVPTGQLARRVLYWYEKAAAAGNPIAQLHMLFLNPPSEENRRSMAVLLNGAIAGQTIGTAQLAGSSDYRLYDLALGFFYKYPATGSDSSDVVRETWGYLACLHNKECSASERRDYFDTQYSPADAAAILEAAELLEHGGTKNVDFLTSSSFEAHEEE